MYFKQKQKNKNSSVMNSTSPMSESLFVMTNSISIYYTDLGSSIETFILHMLLIKNPHFLPNDFETRSKLSTLEYLILTEFRNHWVKIVDFLIKAYVQ